MLIHETKPPGHEACGREEEEQCSTNAGSWFLCGWCVNVCMYVCILGSLDGVVDGSLYDDDGPRAGEKKKEIKKEEERTDVRLTTSAEAANNG